MIELLLFFNKIRSIIYSNKLNIIEIKTKGFSFFNLETRLPLLLDYRYYLN